MDAIEVGRQIAASLHIQAVARGAEPRRPYEFVLAEAKTRGLVVEPTSPGAGVLNGGRASLVPEDGLILHEDIGTPFERAFLVAHEIGHIVLGDGGTELTVRQTDPARPSEASPVGFDRVVDYGRRQRREVQMDLFAREFLLPRPVVRKLHVEDGLTASEIAQLFQAPFDVVAQQLLDALLLPPIAAVPDPEKTEQAPNANQIAAAAHRGVGFLLEAGPGTGKTQTLIARVQGLLTDGVDPRRILLLTFSNKAAGEMAERIAREDSQAAAAMWIGTFHAFGLDIIRRFHVELGLPDDPRLMDRTEAAELLEVELPRLALQHYRNLYDPTQIISDFLAAISRAKDEVVDPQRYAQLAADMRATASSAASIEAAMRASEVAKVYAAYEAIKHAAKGIDFGDLVAMPVRLLESNREIRDTIRARYDHILVDEYQDVNRSSVRLLEALTGDGRNLWVVGDGKQSIYRFRGASSFNVARFGAEDFPGGKRGRLELNYRSVEEVVDAFSAFATGMSAATRESRLNAQRGGGGHKPEIRTVEQSRQLPVALAQAIEEMRGAGYRFRDQAVLCTGNERLSEIGRDLERMGVPVLFLGSLFERPEVKDLLSLLSILVDRRAMGLVRAACSNEFAMSMPDVAIVLDHLRVANLPPAEWLSENSPTLPLSPEGADARSRLAAALRGFDRTSQPWAVLATLLLDRTRLAAAIASADGVAERSRGIAIWQFMNFVRVQPAAAGLPIARLLERVRRLVRLNDDRDLRQLPGAAHDLDAVRLMTLHGAKGLEFPVVHVPGMNGDTLPRTPPTPTCPPPDHLVAGAQGNALAAFRESMAEEQECLFYVALSRARDRLFLYATTTKSDGSRRPISRFVERLGNHLVSREIRSAPSLPAALDAAPIPVAVDGALRFSAHQIALYESCARRFFYTHVLGIGGRRTMTAFMQMHEAVRTVTAAIIADVAGTIDDREIERCVGSACMEHGLGTNSRLDDYRALAVGLVRYFVTTRSGDRRIEAPTPISLPIDGNDHIIVQADDVIVEADGVRKLRRVRTGHQGSTEAKDVGAAAFVLAAKQAFPNAVVEFVHLSDGKVTPLLLSKKELEGRREKLSQFMSDIRRGLFPPNPSSRTCPGCPAFFICGPTPAGILAKKF